MIATASAANHELLRRLGADVVIDYRAADFATDLADIDVVLDTVGGETRERSWPVLRPGGTLVAIAMPPPDAAAAARYGVLPRAWPSCRMGTHLARNRAPDRRQASCKW